MSRSLDLSNRKDPDTTWRDASAIPQSLPDVVIAIWEFVQLRKDAGREDRAYKVKGPITSYSGLGQAVRLKWVRFTSVCEPECWGLHCPTPGTHMRKFYLTLGGHHAVEALRALIPDNETGTS